jgi:hypothetical protein
MLYRRDDGGMDPPDPDDPETERATRTMLDLEQRVQLHASRVTDERVRGAAEAMTDLSGYIFGDGLDDLDDTRALIGEVSTKFLDLVGDRLRALYTAEP